MKEKTQNSARKSKKTIKKIKIQTDKNTYAKIHCHDADLVFSPPIPHTPNTKTLKHTQ